MRSLSNPKPWLHVGPASSTGCFYPSFGLGEPRVLAAFPEAKNWRKRVMQAAEGLDGPAHTRVVELVKRLVDCHARRGGTFQDPPSWLENAEREAARFQAVIARANPRAHTAVITASNLGASPDARWDIERGMTPPRTHIGIAGALAPVLQACTTVVFVDPYFNPAEFRFRRPLEEMLRVARYKRDVPLNRVEILTAPWEVPGDVRTAATQKLAPLLPAGLRVVLKELIQRPGGEKLHQRYVLTDLGGVRVDPGLDEGPPGETYDVNLMARTQYETRWNQYASTSMGFDVGATVEMFGSKK